MVDPLNEMADAMEKMGDLRTDEPMGMTDDRMGDEAFPPLRAD